jgi:hypothetical protein
MPEGRIQTLAYDRAADDGEIHEVLAEAGIRPVIENRRLWKDDPERRPRVGKEHWANCVSVRSRRPCRRCTTRRNSRDVPEASVLLGGSVRKEPSTAMKMRAEEPRFLFPRFAPVPDTAFSSAFRSLSPILRQSTPSGTISQRKRLPKTFSASAAKS